MEPHYAIRLTTIEGTKPIDHGTKEMTIYEAKRFANLLISAFAILDFAEIIVEVFDTETGETVYDGTD